jgi:SAM-dependent methyltransferase
MASYLSGIDTTIHPEDEMLVRTLPGYANPELARAVYLRQGHEIDSTVQSILDWSQSGHRKHAANVLDFACGYGRATRFLVSQVNPSNVWVSDIDAGAVEFQKKQFGVNGFVSCHDPRDLLCEVRFDFICVASLFTHLPRPRFEDWLERLFELLRPKGLLAFSVHDAVLAGGRTMPVDGFMFVAESESRTLAKEEYGSTYVSEAYVAGAIRRVAAKDWHYRRLPLALCGSHDLYLLSRDPDEDFHTLSYVQPPVGYIELFSLSPGGDLRLAGWAADHDPNHRIRDLSLSVGGIVLANITPRIERHDVVRAFGKSHLLLSGWDVSVAGIDRDKQSSEVVEVLLTSTTGKSTVLHSSLLCDAALPE